MGYEYEGRETSLFFKIYVVNFWTFVFGVVKISFCKLNNQYLNTIFEMYATTLEV